MRYEFARALILAEELDAAREVLESLLADDPGHLRAARDLLRVAQLGGEPAAVMVAVPRLLALERSDDAVVALAKGLRQEERFDEAGALLSRHAADKDSPRIAREQVRNLFFLARFAEAAALGEACVDRHPEDLELRLLAAAARLELGLWREAERHVCYVAASGGDERLASETALYLFATTRKAGLLGPAFARLDPLFLAMGCQTVRPSGPAERPVFDRLEGRGRYPASGSADGFEPVLAGPLVSVVMTAHDAAAYVETAVRSILDQSYRNLELVVVDDASTDATPDILEMLERRDPRLRAIVKTGNDGTYVAKNLGLLQARGAYVALQDADDWSHPDRLAKSVAVLEARPDVVGLTTDWLRMTSDGEVVVKAGGQIAHVCCISLVFRREPVLRRVGFFDSVRIEADMEYIRRMGLAFGPGAVLRLRWPLLFGRSRSDSLTASEEFGLTRTGYTEPRRLYQAAYKAWHARIAAGASSPLLPFPLAERPFTAPAIMLPRPPTPAAGGRTP